MKGLACSDRDSKAVYPKGILEQAPWDTSSPLSVNTWKCNGAEDDGLEVTLGEVAADIEGVEDEEPEEIGAQFNLRLVSQELTTCVLYLPSRKQG